MKIRACFSLNQCTCGGAQEAYPRAQHHEVNSEQVEQSVVC